MKRVRLVLCMVVLAVAAAAAQIVVPLPPGGTAQVTCPNALTAVATSSSSTLSCAPDVIPPTSIDIVVNHTSIALFDRIPASYLAAARNLKLMMRIASVGDNISFGLNCLRDNTNISCRSGFSVPATVVPIAIRPEYDRANWNFAWRGNPGWYGKVSDFEAQIAVAPAYDVLSYMHDYVDSTTIYRLWDRASTLPNITDVESVETTGKQVVYWTASLAKVPLAHITQFNETMRAYTATRGVPLFDLADIETDGGRCGETVCPEYASEPEGGHLSNGMSQTLVAKAWWVLMAQLAGWRP